jgi:hypothetical protein
MKTSCRECEAIELEYRKVCFRCWLKCSMEIKEAYRLLGRLAGGTEDDVVRLEELPRLKRTRLDALCRRPGPARTGNSESCSTPCASSPPISASRWSAPALRTRNVDSAMGSERKQLPRFRGLVNRRSLSDTTTIIVLLGLGHFLAIATVIRPSGNCRQTNTCFMSPAS